MSLFPVWGVWEKVQVPVEAERDLLSLGSIA